MKPAIQFVDGITIDYLKSSMQLFPALKKLDSSSELYLKFSKNHIRTNSLERHAVLLLDFDLCLIDRRIDETAIQLFAIFSLSRKHKPVDKWVYVEQAIQFARSLIIAEIEKENLCDRKGDRLKVPDLVCSPDSIGVEF